jgi:hypothetical protein
MYGEMRLNEEAGAAYTAALELAAADGDSYIQAEAAGGLACVTDAPEHHESARVLYADLGDPEPTLVCERGTP